jgi:endonuclease/exonuclease/phosphatase family metal-dependent hydrolase
MNRLKLTAWNVEHFRRVFEGAATTAKARRRAAIVREIRDLAPHVLCVLEGPRAVAGLKEFVAHDLEDDYVVVEAPDGVYATRGEQWIWFLVHRSLQDAVALLPISTWQQFAGQRWTVHYWGNQQAEQHSHYRHPQTLVLTWGGQRVEFIGLHLKSKFINRGRQMWEAGGAEQEAFVAEAIKARIKLATEATNVRRYLDAKFGQVEKPAIIVLGDLNDGPGKEYFEDQYLFFDLVSTLQGEVFFARKFLGHALFDWPEHLRWSVRFDDFVEVVTDRPILLDHIMFTQGLADGSLPVSVVAQSGRVEHEIHALINAPLPATSHTSDHVPVSVELVRSE